MNLELLKLLNYEHLFQDRFVDDASDEAPTPPAKVFPAARPLTGRHLQVFQAVGDRGWIAGSFATWTAMTGAPEPGDLDIFCRTTDLDVCEAVAKSLEAIGYQATRWSQFSQTFVDQTDPEGLTLQLVYPQPWHDVLGSDLAAPLERYGETPEDLVKNFDISVAQAVIVSPTEVWVSGEWRMDATRKEARIVNPNTPLRSAARLGKYHAKGWKVWPYEYEKLFNAWAELDPDQRHAQYYS